MAQPRKDSPRQSDDALTERAAPAAGGATSTPATDRATPRILAVADAVGAFIEGWGFKAIHGRAWTILALRREPTSQVELADILGVSRSLVSAAVSELADYGLVRAVDEHRNAPYAARLDVWPSIADVLRRREWMLIERARQALETAVEELEYAEEGGLETPYDLGRLRTVMAMTDLAQTVLRAILAIRVPRTPDAFAKWMGDAATIIQRFKSLL